jgi:hypothetical protein
MEEEKLMVTSKMAGGGGTVNRGARSKGFSTGGRVGRSPTLNFLLFSNSLNFAIQNQCLPGAQNSSNFAR